MYPETVLEGSRFQRESRQSLYNEGYEGQGPWESSAHSRLGCWEPFTQVGEGPQTCQEKTRGSEDERGPGQILTDAETGVDGEMPGEATAQHNLWTELSSWAGGNFISV